MKKKIIEITSLEELMEFAGVSNIQGTVMNPAHFKDKKDPRGDVQVREEIQAEAVIRNYIRQQIRENLHEEKKLEEQQEHQLRLVVRQLIKETAATIEEKPHPLTPINFLRDVYKIAKSDLIKYYTTLSKEEERKDFVKQFQKQMINMFDQLKAKLAVGKAPEVPGVEEDKAEIKTDELQAPTDDFKLEEAIMQEILKEVKVEIEDDDEMDIITDKEEEEKEKEKKKDKLDKEIDKVNKEKQKDLLPGEDASGLSTGDMQAIAAYNRVYKTFATPYLKLSTDEDWEIFEDWALYNNHLLFKNLENELFSDEAPEIEKPEGV